MKMKLSWPTTLIMVPLAAIVGLPFYYILVNTLKTQEQAINEPLALPNPLYLQNYVDVFQNSPLLQGFLNSLYVTVISIALMLVIGSMAAFGMLVNRDRLNKIIGVILVLAFIIPGQTTLIPLYQMMVGLHLVDTLNGLIALYAGGAIFCYFLIQGYMKTIPWEIIEAARIDGAGMFRIYWQIVLPLIRPILVTVGVFETMWIWNDFFYPNVFLSSPQNQTLVLQVYAAVSQFTTNWPAFMTMTVIVLIPMVVFFVVMQRHIISGLVSGSVKG
jgi:raffinose/stachyose/melibiose transport system permease protein